MSKLIATLNMAKKPATKDWHNADIIAVIHKAGTSLRQLSFDHGYTSPALSNALRHPAPKYERIIAEFIASIPKYKGTKAQDIWPSRYHKDGTPKSGRGERGLGRYKPKFNGSSRGRNVNLRRAA